MRGLTPAERALLLDMSSRSGDHDTLMPLDEVRLLPGLIECARVAEVESPDGRAFFVDITPTGLLALECDRQARARAQS